MDASEPKGEYVVETSGEYDFTELYGRQEGGYGEVPSPVLGAFLEHIKSNTVEGKLAYDLGAGAGRETLAMARSGFRVVSVDASSTGLERLSRRASEAGLSDRVQTHYADVRKVQLPSGEVELLAATTILDHIPTEDARRLWNDICNSLTPSGVIYIEVHTTDDPGHNDAPEVYRSAPASESADAVVNYFRPNELASWACDPDSGLRILHYEEYIEWDETHGPDHLHGKAILLAERYQARNSWFGQNRVAVPPKGILPES